MKEPAMRPFPAVRLAGTVLLTIVMFSPSSVSAHAIPERAEPPIDGVVADPPRRVGIWFTEEVDPSETRVEVIGPDGSRVDRGDATVDLNDPNRQHVTVSLNAGLRPGTYIVQWHSVSAIDRDTVDGSFRFTVDPAATPQASVSPVISTPTRPAGTDDAGTPLPTPVDDDYDFPGRDFGLSIAVGLTVAVLIFAFWRFVRSRLRP
jgi:methionine-rich copper-binding protein CopC